MKLSVCQSCRHRLWSTTYAPKYCRECGGNEIKSYSFGDWIILGFVAILILKFII